MNPHSVIWTIFVFLFGLEFGSFANVCIYRWPRSASVIHPRRSFCPWCNHQIRWADNIPVLSFLLLRGKCRQCASPISLRYPLIEFITAILWVAAFRLLPLPTGVEPAAVLAAVLTFLFVTVVTTMTDFDWRLIPDEASAVLAGIGLVTSFANPLLGPEAIGRLAESVLGMAVGGGLIWLVGEVGSRLFGRDAMGGGDVKLLGAMGTVLGWQGALLTLFLAAFLGGLFAAVGLLRGRLKRGQYLPFGPFLNLAGVIVLFALISGAEPSDFLLRWGM